MTDEVPARPDQVPAAAHEVLPGAAVPDEVPADPLEAVRPGAGPPGPLQGFAPGLAPVVIPASGPCAPSS